MEDAHVDRDERVQKDATGLMQRWGRSDGAVLRHRVAVAAWYFRAVLRESPFNWESYLKGIDFNERVWLDWLDLGREVSRHRPSQSTRKPFVYLTSPGESPFRTGTSFPDRTFELYEVMSPVRALVSHCAGIRFPGDTVERWGGAIQYVVPAHDFERDLAVIGEVSSPSAFARFTGPAPVIGACTLCPRSALLRSARGD